METLSFFKFSSYVNCIGNKDSSGMKKPEEYRRSNTLHRWLKPIKRSKNLEKESERERQNGNDNNRKEGTNVSFSVIHLPLQK